MLFWGSSNVLEVMMVQKLELHAIFHGIVQGVFFRATVYKHAQRVDVKGTVKNLLDGTVEVFAQGTEEELNTFLDDIQENPRSAVIERVKKELYSPKGSFENFDIIY